VIGTLTRAATLLLACCPAAFSANLPVADPINDVRICTFTYAGMTSSYTYIPGTDTCLAVHGYARAETHYVNGDTALLFNGTSDADFNNWTTRARGGLEIDARTRTELGDVRTFIQFVYTVGPDNFDVNYDGTDVDLDEASIAVSGNYGSFTAGKTDSFFDFFSSDTYGARIDIDDPTEDPILFAYSLGISDGWTGTLSIEDPASTGRRLNGADDYEGQEAPDVIGSIKLHKGNLSAQAMAMLRQIHDVGGDGVGWAAGAGFQIKNVAAILGFTTQATYGEGALGYVTSDPGGIGDFDGPSGSDTNHAWSVRSGVTAKLSSTVSSWLDGSFTHVENHSGSDEYDYWAIVGGAAWTAKHGALTMGPEAGFDRIDGDDPGEDGSVWGVMWRVQRNF
jgi:hypothetical protein